MTALVVGATGTVGRDVVAGLRAAGQPVRAASRSATGPDAVRLDLEDPATWSAALRGVDRLFLLRPPEVARAARLTPFLHAALGAGADRVVLLSVQGADRNPLLPHRALEKAVEALPFRWTHLRPGWFMQNLLSVHRPEVRDRSELFVPAGDGRTAFVDTRDVAAVAVTALTQPGHEARGYELTSAEAPTFGEVADALTTALGRPVRYARPGPVHYVFEQRRRGMPAGLTALTLGIYSATRLGMAGRLTDDLARVLGRPATTLAQFAADHADAWR